MVGTKFGQRPVKNLDSMGLLIICIAVSVGLYAVCITGAASTNSMRYMIQIFLYIALGQMWNLLSGFAGMTSLGQQLYIGLAGYVVAIATTIFHFPLAVGVLLAVGVAIVLSPIISLLMLRLKGMYFSIATWVVAEAFSMFFYSWEYVNQGGGMTIILQPYPRLLEICLFSLTICIAAVSATYILLRSKAGLGIVAMRDDSTAASSVGVNSFRHRVLTCVIAAGFCALAGCAFFINKGVIYPDSGFNINWTVSMIFIVTIGGSGTISGPIVGSIIYVLLQEYLAHFPGWSNIILGIITILTILFLPRGIMGTVQNKLGFEIFSAKYTLQKPKRNSVT